MSDPKCAISEGDNATVPRAILPRDGPGSESFRSGLLAFLLLVVPLSVSLWIKTGLLVSAGLVAVTSVPILVLFWTVSSTIGGSNHQSLPGRRLEDYVSWQNPAIRKKYLGKRRIPMADFTELYFDGQVDFRGDCLSILEFRHDWATFAFTPSLFKYFLFHMLPELMHTRNQDERQTHEVYDRGDSFYHAFLGDTMTFSSGIVSDIHRAESLEQLQHNKMTVVCQKIDLRPDESLLDIGCGWGTFTAFASSKYGARVTGITLSQNGEMAAKARLSSTGISDLQSQVLRADYRDIPDTKYDKIVCLEMAEHVGMRNLKGFLQQMYDKLDDQGVFLLQIGGLRKPWQYEDLVWGLFMNKYIFPGADASVPLGQYISTLESVGFEIKSIDTIGIHYAATIWRWYQQWTKNQDAILEEYGTKLYRIWLYFLGSATIVARQGGATAYQITLVKNRNGTNRIRGIPTQYGINTSLHQ